MYDLAELLWISHLVKFVRIPVRSCWFYLMTVFPGQNRIIYFNRSSRRLTLNRHVMTHIYSSFVRSSRVSGISSFISALSRCHALAWARTGLEGSIRIDRPGRGPDYWTTCARENTGKSIIAAFRATAERRQREERRAFGLLY